MSDPRFFVRSTPSAGAGGTAISPNILNDGTQVVAPWLQSYVNLGYGYHVNIGTFSSPITGGGAGTIVDLDQPEGILSVPAGRAVIPIRFAVHCQPPLLATDADEIEAFIAVDKDTAWVGDGTVTAETPFNLRMNSSQTGGVSAASAATADITDPTLDFELARVVKVGDVQGTAATTMWTELDLVYEPEVRPVFYGPCAIYVYWGGTVAVPGFADLQYVDLPSSVAANLFP
ncbi:MAG: hypothetical protein WC054_12190 [Candidatus Nanopelagicales bacterium]|jgi:hypothetical protein